MQFTVTYDYPACLKRLWTIFGEAEYPSSKYIALGATAVRMRGFHATARLIEVELERDVPVQRSQLPIWTRAFVGRQQTLEHRSVWRLISPTQADAELDIAVVGLPAHAHGVGSIVEIGDELTRMELTWQVESTLGGAIARLFAEQVRAALRDDHVFTLKYLQRVVEHTESVPRGGTPTARQAK